MIPCPSPDVLRRLLADELPPDERAPLEGHIEGCPDCQRVLERLTGESLPGLAGSPAASPRRALLGILGDAAELPGGRCPRRNGNPPRPGS